MERGIERWRKRKSSKRGVSPIIATILLVAITVVLAAVLYILVSGYIGGTGSKPISVGLSPGTPAQSTCGAATNYTEAVSVASVSGTLTTTGFGLRLVNSANGNAIAPAAPSSGCPAAQSWFAQLESPGGAVLDTWVGSWTAASSVTLSSGDIIVVNSAVPITGVATLSVYGVGGTSVSGSTSL